jgi:hypothetical protein
MGQAALFFVEFELDAPIQMPSIGIELFNERSLIVHGKNSFQYGVEAPAAVAAGARLRVRQRIDLDVAIGRYTFALGLASIEPDAARLREEMGYAALAERIRAVLVVKDAGTFSVRLRDGGQALPFHGLCDLEGDAQLAVLQA